jgi:hypothetical protein
MLMSNTKETGKPTIARCDDVVIRCSGRLSCNCGEPLKASDFDIVEIDHDEEMVRVRAVCGVCGQDLFEVESC